MAKLIIGTLDSIEDTDAVIKDLEDAGFERKDIFVTGPPAGRGTGTGAGAATVSDLAPILVHQGVPQDDAREFAGAVQQGKALISCRTGSDKKAELAEEIMARHHAKGPMFEREGTEMREAGMESRRTEVREGEVVIPVVEEALRVGKRTVERSRVRVYTHVTERPVEEDVDLREERVVVERRPADRPATEADLPHGESIEITERAEEPVVAKEARVVEEVVIGKEERERKEKIKGTVRRSDVEIEGAQKEKEPPEKE